MGFPDDSVGNKTSCNVGDLGSISGLGRSPGEGNGYPLQYSGLENSMDCIVHGSQRVRHDCVTFTFIYLSIITLSVNGVNAPVRGHRMAQMIKKQKTSKKKEKRKPPTATKSTNLCAT